jgi:sugar phosphate isomerase/epimerase
VLLEYTPDDSNRRKNELKKKMQIGYCGNVHPGRTIDEVKQNLIKYSLDVKSQVRPNKPMGIGLWLSATAAKELDDSSKLVEFRDWLAEVGLLPFTLNGFPYGDFHQEVVKHDVYRPTWADPARLEYTVRLAEILNVLLPEGIDGTISTLPLGWPTDAGKSNIDDEQFWKSSARNLKTCAERLDDLAQTTGRNVFICIEPEPGCILDTCDDVIAFFDQHLFVHDTNTNQLIRNHIGVCHDVCHSAVMFEEQATAINDYANADIRIGKVQVSSAVAVDFDSGANDELDGKLSQLSKFAEPKYLHQTSVATSEEVEFYEDLDLAIKANETHLHGQWRVHFHVPIFSESLGLIDTTQTDIKQCVDAIQATGNPLPHFEIETYAWNVLPKGLEEISLADGIAKEIAWFDELVK